MRGFNKYISFLLITFLPPAAFASSGDIYNITFEDAKMMLWALENDSLKIEGELTTEHEQMNEKAQGWMAHSSNHKIDNDRIECSYSKQSCKFIKTTGDESSVEYSASQIQQLVKLFDKLVNSHKTLAFKGPAKPVIGTVGKNFYRCATNERPNEAFWYECSTVNSNNSKDIITLVNSKALQALLLNRKKNRSNHIHKSSTLLFGTSQNREDLGNQIRSDQIRGVRSVGQVEK